MCAMDGEFPTYVFVHPLHEINGTSADRQEISLGIVDATPRKVLPDDAGNSGCNDSVYAMLYDMYTTHASNYSPVSMPFSTCPHGHPRAPL